MALSRVGVVGLPSAMSARDSLPAPTANNPVSQVTSYLFSFQDGLDGLVNHLAELKAQWPDDPRVVAFGQALANLIASHSTVVQRITAQLR